MAEFPEGNPGVWPIDVTSPVGRFRLTYGDTSATSYEPPESGVRNFEELSDAEIEAFLAQGGDSVARGIGYLYLAMAGHAAKEALTVKDYDLTVDQTKRAADLRAMAREWFDIADQEDVSSSEEGFVIVPTGRSCGGAIPEGAPPIYGRVYGVGRVC